MEENMSLYFAKRGEGLIQGLSEGFTLLVLSIPTIEDTSEFLCTTAQRMISGYILIREWLS